MNKLLIFCLFSVIGVSVGQILQNGQCPTVIPVVNNFDIAQFQNVWYELLSTPTVPGECPSFELTSTDAAITATYSVNNKNFFEHYQYNAALVPNSSTFTVTNPVDNAVVDVHVLTTDYSNYAVLYACENVGLTQRNVYVWQMARLRYFFNDLIPTLMNSTIFDLVGLTHNDLKTLDHSDNACYQLPILEANEPVILPGQCDTNINGVANFDVGRFLGVWHQISSYYSESSVGECNRAQYSDGGAAVTVVNSEVVGQALRTVVGNATVASTDGSARLNVVLEVLPGVFAESELLVLATDYNQWAISYTCVNLNNNSKRIFSWIVSRTRQLPESARIEVDQFVDTIIDLNDYFYQDTDQSNEACFYFPDPVPNEPPVFGGQCDLNIPVQPNFDAVAYMNLWHTIQSYPAPFQDGTCSNAFYTLNGGIVDVYNTQVIDQRLDTINGVAVPVDNAKLAVTFPVAGTDFTIDSDYWVISTDHTSYALVYSCRNVNDYQQQVTVWKLSRTKELSAAANTAINNAMTNIPVLDQRYFEIEDQTREGCFYFPEPTGNPVEFPGQCGDEDIPVVANFDRTRFQGLWHEIQAYPKDDQEGVCVNHRFTVDALSAFSLESSSVVSQFLGVTAATVFYTSTDNSARFTISFTSNGNLIEIPYWIVETDYDNYALAYSCVNLNNDFRGVYSWKLSRTKQLPAASATAINNVIENLTVLDNVYFEDIDQSDDACFYLPELNFGEPVILPGQCNTTINGVANFNVGEFLGVWHQISSYYSESSLGECNRAQYSDGGAAVTVVNSEVVGQALLTVAGSATVASTDGSGRLNVVLEVLPGVFVETELLVLATDYNQWAISYTCQNLSDDRRQIFSWIVSRTRVLPVSAISQINEVISSYVELNDRYFEPTDQSNEACFYFPEPVPNEPPIFGGQCDLNIPVQPNFDAVAYMNLWHTIQSYPAPFQDGTCSNAFYTLNGGIVDVYNTQVIDQRLDTLNGVAVPIDNAKLVVTFPIVGTNFTIDSDYWVISTDHTSYALVYSCRNVNDYQQQVTVWKLSRTKELSVAANTAINNAMTNIPVLDQRYFEIEDQTREGCFYFPEPTGNPVEFPGQCGDEDIPVVANFDRTRFQGLWHEIQAYPKDDQEGVCVNHRFTVDAVSAFSLESSSVVSQFLGVTAATVSYTSTDNSARFTISFTSNGNLIEIPYWIVETDYDNYALAYSCVNLNNDFRGVYSWKLSRTKQLPAASATAINNVIENLAVLDNVYFEDIDQSDDACFYLPELNFGEPVILPGQCNTTINGVANFNVGEFLGVWHQISSYYSESSLGECNRAQYSDGGAAVTVVNSEVVGQALLTVAGSATVASTDGSARLNVVLEVLPGVFVETELLVLATDYNQWAISYTCQNLSDDRRQIFSWIVSRTRVLPVSAISQINEVISSYVELNDRYFEPTDQSNEACFYFPEPVPNEPPIFGGQCDLNIPVQPNFDAVAYMNLWHTIQSYPAPFQDGTCSNAFYTLNGGIVDVYNTQVIDQRLDTLNGVAVPIDNAKLVVTFPIVGTNFTIDSDYWVISTDHTSYALVYSCRNVNDYQQQVTVWKLSRTKELSVAANTAINNAMTNIPVLDQRYFEIEDQTREGCFYFPEPTGNPVEFPGQCGDEDIPVVANFDRTRFQGLWHEIQAYPKDDQEGVCVNHRFTVDAVSAFSLESSSVVSQFLGVTAATVSYTSTDNSARFTISFTSNGNLIEIPYWIVETDYDNYALAYSCVNLNNDFRGVYSWKLSRTKQLPAASATAINNVIENLAVLDNVYFEDIDQSDDACFYLPELNFGEPVILPGQCNTTINGVANFNVGEFLGVWHQISSYYSESSLGECNRAQYSDGGAAVTVVNSEVVGQALLTVAGSATVASTDGSARLNVVLEVLPGVFVETELLVLATDYNQWAISYTCQNLSDDRRQIFSWIVSRTRVLPVSAISQINEVISSYVELNDRYFEPTDQSNEACFYFPEPVPNEPPIFGGQCDLNIPVQPNFDAVAYMNLWHTIQSYPAPFQDGTCSNAFYTLNGGIVDVYNTQVIDQRLDTINGVAVPVDNAKLVVTFPIVGTNFTIDSDYWVISTDHTSYALVYSCRNVNDYQQQVTVWKLSRTRELSVAANTAINNAMTNIPVLDQRYFEIEDQTREGCFYFPESTGNPVEFPGQCGDEDIPVIQNFDLNRFSGVWHEIETYPKDDQPGQCISHTFNVAANGFSLQSTNVLAQTLGVTDSTVTFSSNDNSGRFTISFVSNGNTIQIIYWIVDTDYDNYAVAYSCADFRNQDLNYRNVYSWKLSKTRNLSEASNNAINTAIANVLVLDNMYYETVSHTDDSCFYLPDLPFGEPVILPGQCDTSYTGIANFNVGRFLGVWHEVSSYYSENSLGECNRAQYSDGGAAVTVVNSEVVGQALRTVVGNATVASTDGSGRLNVVLEVLPGVFAESELFVLGTDYDSWAVTYTCQNLDDNRRRVFSWIASRTRQLPAAVQVQVDELLNQYVELDNRYYEPADQSDNACFYFPEPVPGASVIFGGQCDQNIPVVNNFDAVAYMNLWHDIQSYPQDFQDGTCSNAFYSLSSVVDVYNTQVINQTLDTITGFAIPLSDTEAKLLVYFILPGTNITVTSNYWVISTDYFSYSLVYSCRNINDYQQEVTSWKLSRTKQLSAAANAAINNAMASIPVLDQRFFVDEDQSREGCFYFPEPTGNPVEFPGQCGDEDIPVVANFDLNRFEGLWHEVQAYPKDDQEGQCISHQFSPTNNGFSLQSFNVIAQSLGVTDGAVTFSSNDNSGRFTITFTSNGTVIEIPYWIVATDYDNYALAYSCVNVNDDFREVYSWKLSRTKQLSAASNIAINNVMSNTAILDNTYFENIDQSDTACFYFPDLAPGQSVIFPGQCASNIPVVQNFDAARYLNTWRLIENYPSDFQLGDCGEALYTLGDGVVLVENTEVINETLSSAFATAVVASTDGSGVLLVTFPNAPPLEYYILATDYDSYAFVYSCININEDQRRIFSWKLSRTNSLTQQAVQAINQAMTQIDVLVQDYYETVDRSPEACFYFPEPNGEPVVFRGECDQDIGVVGDFIPQDYTGIWYNIESYPAPFQGGTCGTAEYTLDPETLIVAVENSQVLNQVLDIQTGTAVVASTDGSAKLSVTFEVNGVNVTSDYWVLATDYTSYSLVYACADRGDGYKQVTSFKLSRSKSLPDTSLAPITAAIDRVKVLEERYFEEEGQSEDDCFYYPDNEGRPVTLAGQCVADNQVLAVTNFDSAAFAGIWHEMSRFLSSMQTRQCTANELSFNQNALTITQTDVTEDTLYSSVISGSLVDATRGAFAVSGVEFENLYVLATDYSNYALLYGCRNIDTQNKQIYSWKLSKSRDGLSQAANDEIDQVVSANIDLFEGYYEVTDQSNDACFHYPEFEEMPPFIELLGPCDESIGGMINFDAAAYLGIWYDVESYPDPNQLGTCGRAHYLSVDGELVVDNTQVIDETLYRQLGVAELEADGIGQLNVTFDVNGVIVNARYFVLATDYSNYALVYTCRNLANGNRQVNSWKLSRSSSLSNDAINQMNTVIERTQGLNQRYYQQTDQSADGCFYVPQPSELAPLFRWQCDDSTPMTNFDQSRFLGIWHEVERYTKDNDQGTCSNNHFLETDDNTYQAVDTSVFGALATVSSQTVQITSDGRLNRIDANGVASVTLVLATDYDNYALVYNCEQVDSEYARVWSAKHSRTRQLTQADQDAIAPVIEDHKLLYQQLYQTVDQSDAVCFAYNWAGSQVTMPGQCDQNIAVVQNFNASAYEGTWYQIERYPQLYESQDSSCNGVSFTLIDDSNEITINNWQLLDDSLETFERVASLAEDGSGRLTLPEGGEGSRAMTLHLLATDYEEYSIVYTCRNIDTVRRSVSAYKLSRTRSLSTAAASSIDQYVSSSTELHQPYFVSVEQNEDCPDPSAGVFLKSSIIVMIVCAMFQYLL